MQGKHSTDGAGEGATPSSATPPSKTEMTCASRPTPPCRGVLLLALGLVALGCSEDTASAPEMTLPSTGAGVAEAEAGMTEPASTGEVVGSAGGSTSGGDAGGDTTAVPASGGEAEGAASSGGEDPSTMSADPAGANEPVSGSPDGTETAGASGTEAETPVMDPDPATSEGQGEDEVTFTLLYEKVFISCRLFDCHGSGWGGFSMASRELAYEAFIDQPATPEGPCADMGWVRVVPGQPDESLLVVKLLEKPPCGLQMSPGELLSEEQQEMVRRWIAEGAEDN